MSKLKYLFVALVLAIVLMPSRAHADVNDFVITNFTGKYDLSDSVHGGKMIVTEQLDVTFTDFNHGILRSLPRRNQNTDLHLKVLKVERDNAAEPYTTYNDNNGNMIIKIGDANRQITGPHSYLVSYEASRGVVSFFPDKTEWYWDINGTGWFQPFTKVSGEVILPSTAFSPDLSKSCYTGLNGSQGTDCVLTPTDHGYKFTSTRPFVAGENLSVAIQLKDSSFQKYNSTDWVRDNIKQLIGVAFGLLALILAFMGWWRYGRDYKGKGTIIPEYEPPQGMSPAEVGLVADYQLQGRDISATLIDLAVRGYIVITDNTTKWFGFIKRPDFQFELKREPLALKPHEQAVIEIIFPTLAVGTVQKLKDISNSSASIKVSLLRKTLVDSLTSSYGAFEPSGKRWSAIYTGVGIAFIALLFFVRAGFGIGWTIGFVIATISFMSFASVMQRRSHAGVEAYEKIKGLELYMKTAEADRLKMLQSVDRPYAAPQKTYDLFEKLLPYAIALGVEKSWAKQFDGLFNKSPDWYQGSAANNFSAAYFATSLTDGMSGLNQSFSAQSGSTSSGSGGGGSSGGGGGGGGGGGW